LAIDEQKIDQTILALLYLTLHGDCRAWKSFDWQAMTRLHEKGLIESPVNKAKSVVLTEKGLTEAERLFKKLFVKTPMPKQKITFDPELATEAKSLVVFAFRNGPIEAVHTGKECPVCAGKPEYSHITQDEMKNIMKQAVDTVYNLLWLKQNDPEKYAETLEYGNRCTKLWDDPRLRT
jgi:hypothetical protein